MSQNKNISLETKLEKEKMIIELLQEGKTSRQIAETVHVSFGDIGTIRRRLIGTQEEKDQLASYHLNTKSRSVCTHAFQLFSKGKSRVEVAIKLNLPALDIEKLSKDYWLLKGLDRLPKIYEDIKVNRPAFFKLYHLVKEKKISNEDILTILKHVAAFSRLEKTVIDLEKQVDELVFQKGDKLGELESIKNKVAESSRQLSEIQKEIVNRKFDLQWLSDEIYKKRSELQQLQAQLHWYR
jgi:predicted nuclease with TOPRIM domain